MKTNVRFMTIMVVTIVSLLLVTDARGVICTYESAEIPKEILDTGTVYSSLNIPESIIIVDVDVELSITHDFAADLDVFLIAPDGKKVELFTDVGGASSRGFQSIILDDEAGVSIAEASPPFTGSYRPEGSLSIFDGFDAKGTWQLKVMDDYRGDTGVLQSWCLIIDKVQEPYAGYSGGTGEPNDPYRIATAEDLNTIGLHEEDWGKHFILVNDIDLSAYTSNQFNIIGKGTAQPWLGEEPHTGFSGVFDGRGHRIWNFTYISTNKNCVALFRYLLPGGQIKNVGMENVTVDSGGEGIVGALVGYNDGTVNACYSKGSIKSGDKTGGLVGMNGYQSPIIMNCYSSVSILPGCWEYGGGLVGFNGGTIINSYSTGKVWDVGFRRGGLAGGSHGVVNCFWDIETSGQSVSGGGKDRTTAEMKMASTYFGWGGCGNEGVWTIDDGNDYPRLAWEGRPGQPIPKQQLSDLVPGSGTEADPYLISTPEQLNAIGLFPCECDKHFKLINDIDLSAYKGTEFNIIGMDGVFDGDNHKIWNFTWDNSGQKSGVGLFGGVRRLGVIKNVGLENVNVNTPDDSSYLGALTGSNYGTIRNCYASGKVAGTNQVGGLVGCHFGWIMEACYFNGIVSGGYGSQNDVGGLIGQNGGCLWDCYSTADVSGGDRIGGLVGFNGAHGPYDIILRCYSTGKVSGLTNVGGLVGSLAIYQEDIGKGSFWDVETSGQTTSAAGQAKTTAEMKTKSTFTDAGWDFVEIWDIIEGQTYPFLR